MEIYQEGDLHRLIADDSHNDLHNMVEQVLPRHEAAAFEAEVHVILTNILGPSYLLGLAHSTACTLAQAGFLLGVRAGCQMTERLMVDLDELPEDGEPRV